jgi:hypothetical protein
MKGKLTLVSGNVHLKLGGLVLAVLDTGGEVIESVYELDG